MIQHGISLNPTPMTISYIKNRKPFGYDSITVTRSYVFGCIPRAMPAKGMYGIRIPFFLDTEKRN